MSSSGGETHHPPIHDSLPPRPRYRAFGMSGDDTNVGSHTPARPQFFPATWRTPQGIQAPNPLIPPQPPAPIVVQAPSNPRYMPSPYDRNAPRFDGHPLSLGRFFGEIERLGRSCQLSPREMIEHTLAYLAWNEHNTWKELPAAAGSDWERFKQEIIAIYPGADEDHKYTFYDLEALANRQAITPMTSRYQFGEYYRQFLTIGMWLFRRNEISQRERDMVFFSGFDPLFRERLTARLRLKMPDYPPRQPWDMGDVAEAALYLLDTISATNEPTGFPSHTPYTQSYLQPQYSIPPAPPAVTTQTSIPPPPRPRETYDLSTMEQFFTSEAFVSKLAGKLGGLPTTSAQHSNSLSTQHRNTDCSFCSDPRHFHHKCPTAEEYIRKGLCIRTAERRIALSDGTVITARVSPGKDIKEKLDNYYKARNTSTVATNIVEAAPAVQTHQYSWVQPQESPEETSENISVEELEELRLLDTVAVSSLKRAEDIRKRAGNLTKTKTNPSVNIRAGNKTQPSTLTPPTSAIPSSSLKMSDTPQFRYTTPVEDPTLVQQVLDKVMDTPVVITHRQFLAASPEVRRFVKEQVTTKRVPTTTAKVSSFEGVEDTISSLIHSPQTSEPNNLIVANDVEDLRTIELEVEGKIKVDAILDEGSQIISMRRDVWEKLGIPMRSDKFMVMESANSSREPTMGFLPNLRVSVGDCTLYLQVQVVENASYEILLGRPFLTLTQANTRHLSNGGSYITLVDPNSNQVVTVPTKPRIRSSSTQSGF